MAKKEAQTAAQRKKLERDKWRKDGGAFKEIKLTKEGVSILVAGREKERFKKDWEFINFLLKEYNKCLRD